MSKQPKYQTLEVKDPHVSYRIKKGEFPDLPCRTLIIGKSQLSGKSNLLVNKLIRTDTDLSYWDDFEGRNMYIISPTSDLDFKMKQLIKYKRIPQGNISDEYDEDQILALYDYLEAKFHNDEKKEHTAVIFDDCAFSGDLKHHQAGAIAKLFMNGRHLLISTFVLSQKYTLVSTGARGNCTAVYFFSTTPQEIKTIYEDHGCGTLKDFMRIFKDYTREPHSWICVNYSNPPESRYLDQHYEPIKELCDLC